MNKQINIGGIYIVCASLVALFSNLASLMHIAVFHLIDIGVLSMIDFFLNVFKICGKYVSLIWSYLLAGG